MGVFHNCRPLESREILEQSTLDTIIYFSKSTEVDIRDPVITKWFPERDRWPSMAIDLVPRLSIVFLAHRNYTCHIPVIEITLVVHQ